MAATIQGTETTESAAYSHTRAKVVFISESLKFLITKYYKSWIK